MVAERAIPAGTPSPTPRRGRRCSVPFQPGRRADSAATAELIKLIAAVAVRRTPTLG
jgi:hypothetical protein